MDPKTLNEIDEVYNGGDDWDDVVPLPEVTIDVEPFDYDLLPESLRGWIQDVAERTQCPPDFPAIGAMVGLSSIIGRKVQIRPKRLDSWTVTPNLWGAIVGKPGIMKTPSLAEVLKPLRGIEVAAKQEYDSLMVEHRADCMVCDAIKKAAEQAVKAAVKNGEDARQAALDAIRQAEEAEKPPVRRRCIINDSTVEKLGEILSENPNGVLMFRDELTGFLKTLDKEGHEASRAFYLESWNGDGRFTYDRIGRGTVDIESAVVSILGGIQPGPLSDYIRAAAGDGRGADGLMQRFQLVVWPDVSGAWRNVDRTPNKVARERAYEVFNRLDSVAPEDVGCEVEEDTFFLRFDDAAQERFDGWRKALELRLRTGSLPEVMECHLSKFRSLVPSLALVCHLADGGIGDVSLEALDRALRWAKYLESHARRIYGGAINRELESAHALANKIQSGALGSPFKLRDVYRSQWSRLRSKEDAQGAVDILEDHGIIRGVEKGQTTVYHVHPEFVNAERPA